MERGPIHFSLLLLSQTSDFKKNVIKHLRELLVLMGYQGLVPNEAFKSKTISCDGFCQYYQSLRVDISLQALEWGYKCVVFDTLYLVDVHTAFS